VSPVACALALLALGCRHGHGLVVPTDAAPDSLAADTAADAPGAEAAADAAPFEAPIDQQPPPADTCVCPDNAPDTTPPGLPCGPRRCSPGQYCVTILPGQVPRPVCAPRPDGGCAPDTTEGCGDAGAAACDIATVPPRCLDLPASCAGTPVCKCFCGPNFMGSCHGPDDHDIVCAFP